MSFDTRRLSPFSRGALLSPFGFCTLVLHAGGAPAGPAAAVLLDSTGASRQAQPRLAAVWHTAAPRDRRRAGAGPAARRRRRRIPCAWWRTGPGWAEAIKVRGGASQSGREMGAA